MFAIAFLFVRVLCDCFKSRRRLEAEVLVLRHQLNVLQQRAPRRLYFSWADRALFVWLYRGYPRIVRDNDRAFGSVFRRRIRITGTLESSFWKRHRSVVRSPSVFGVEY
jgi:hypothetical protein